MEGELNGLYFKSVMNAMITSEISFPELSKKVAELDVKKWYPLQMFSDMLYEVAKKMPPVVMVKIGKEIIAAAHDTLLKFGFDTIEKLTNDISSTLAGIVRKVRLTKVQKTISIIPNKSIFAYSTIFPEPYCEGLIRGIAQIYKVFITKFEVTETGGYHVFTIEVRSNA